jgi:hypothetical protein
VEKFEQSANKNKREREAGEGKPEGAADGETANGETAQ